MSADLTSSHRQHQSVHTWVSIPVGGSHLLSPSASIPHFREAMAGKSKMRMGMDSLSDLPDSILLHIMSFMGMKSVVRTTVLSRRWRNLWKSVLDMDFESTLSSSIDMNFEVTFSDFIDRFIALHEGSKIRKFRVRAEHDLCPHQSLHTWVSFAVRRNVEQLSLDLYPTYGDENDVNTDDRYPTPQCIFNCTSLVSLTLRRCSITAPPSISLPSLSTLSLKRTDLADDLLKNLFAGCPLLEDLTLYDCNRFDDLNIFAENSRLKSLKLIEWEFLISHDTTFRILAPSLLSLDVVDHMPRGRYEVKDLSSLTLASFSFDELLQSMEYPADNFMEHFVELLDQIRHVKVLKLCTGCLVELSIRETRDPNASLTYCTSTLELKTRFSKFELPGLAYILRTFINLEILVVDVEKIHGSSEFEDYFQDEYNFDENKFWKSVDTSFPQMLEHLKSVKIRGIVMEDAAVEKQRNSSTRYTNEEVLEDILTGTEELVEFIRILLKNSAVLETVTINKKRFGYYADCSFVW